jgi:prophage regulatory protein
MSKSDRLLRLNQVLAIIPISKSGWWLGIRTGILPRPVKIGRASLWKYSDIQELINALDRDEYCQAPRSGTSIHAEKLSGNARTVSIRGGNL